MVQSAIETPQVEHASSAFFAHTRFLYSSTIISLRLAFQKVEIEKEMRHVLHFSLFAQALESAPSTTESQALKV
jgi:hypothetical protein